MCLVNESTYIAKYSKDNDHENSEWTATGLQFQVPYVFKTCFSHEEITSRDMCETKEVKTAMHLDMNENLPEGDHDYRFIGKVGLFCPIKPGCGGGELLREQKKKDGSIGMYSVSGSKGYRWLESESVCGTEKEKDIDRSYYDNLVTDAVNAISKYGDYEWFVSNDPYTSPLVMGGTPIYDNGNVNPCNPDCKKRDPS
jgi:hypothetical protein